MIETFQDFLIQVTLFDYIFFVLTIYFLIQGSRKGFVLSLLSAAKWVLAYILTIYLFPKVKPYFDGILDSEYVLDIIVGLILFILIMSNFIPTIYFGVFTGIAMLLAMVSVLTLLPSLLLKIKPFN